MARRFSPPFPVPNPTSSYWQSQPHPTISEFQSKPFLSDADTVIIGSGICGALIAQNLLGRDHGKGKKNLVMLEARTVASGATGRNGGHIKPDCYRGFLDFDKMHGSETARQQCEFERANQQETSAFIKDQGLADISELVDYRSADCFMTKETWERGFGSYQAFAKAGGNVDGIEVLDANEARKTLSVDCAGAITFPACSLWPFKLVIAVIERCIQAGLFLYTNNPALEITISSTRKWQIKTEKGNIQCDRIIHATNGYATYLVPELSQKLVPLRGHVVAIDPSPNYLDGPLRYSYAFHWPDDFDYLIQRPSDGMPLIYGGGDTSHPEGFTNGLGNYDDSKICSTIADHLTAIIPKTFIGWNQDPARRCAWTGIMGLTEDELPFVGELPQKPGQFIAAGYNGHGMARVFLTTRALCQLMYDEAIDSRIPATYFDISGRLEKSLPYWTEIMEDSKSKIEL